MPGFPNVVVELERRTPPETFRLGSADLTYAAAAALGRGDVWIDDRVPPTAEVCTSVGHRARIAAWKGELFAPGLASAFGRLAEAVAAAGVTDLPFRMSVLQAARRVARHADWLAEAVAQARAAPWPAKGAVCVPLTGEIVPVSEAGGVDTPFAFGVKSARFAGVDYRAYADFLDDCDGRMDAAEYLSHSLRLPEIWFRDIASLDAAGMDWLAQRDLAGLSAAVSAWNGLQKVGLPYRDSSVVHLKRGQDARDAVLWCRGHAALSATLADAVSDLSVSARR